MSEDLAPYVTRLHFSFLLFTGAATKAHPCSERGKGALSGSGRFKKSLDSTAAVVFAEPLDRAVP